MTDRQLDPDRDTTEYVTALTAYLFRHRVPGPRIGEVLAEVEAHVAATGESARAAFGPPEDYARAWSVPLTARERWRRRGVVAAAVCATGGIGAVLAAGGLAAGGGTTVFGVNGWWVLGLAAVALIAVLAVLPMDRVIDPRTSRPRSVGRVPLLTGAAVALLVVVALLVATGAWTSTSP
jgi:hypothetical protein